MKYIFYILISFVFLVFSTMCASVIAEDYRKTVHPTCGYVAKLGQCVGGGTHTSIYLECRVEMADGKRLTLKHPSVVGDYVCY